MNNRIKHTEAAPLAYILALVMLLIPLVNFFFWIPIVFIRRTTSNPSRMNY